jgi:hypothetical protein
MRARTAIEAIASGSASLTAIVLGLSAGAMLAEGAVMVPWWRSLSPHDFLAWYADNAARLFDFFGPLEIAGAVLALAAAGLHFALGWPGRGWFLAAALLAVAVLAAFPLYFQEVNAGFATATIAPDHVPGELARWAAWHAVRTAIGIVACGAAVLGVRAGAGKANRRPD